jgi:aminoglycoside 3-N-acetyltransferase
MISDKAITSLPAWQDSLLLLAERMAKQVLWSCPRIRAWVRRRQAGRRSAPVTADRHELKEYLRQIGVVEGALVMAHTSVSGLTLTEGPDQPPARLAKAAQHLLQDLLELVGETGTLVMPTIAPYQAECDYANALNRDYVYCYDPAKTPCATGLANELFRRWPGVQRSLHPYNTVAVRGPLADELLRDNLNQSKPLPHGVHSAHYRFCQRNGLVVSIGVPLGPNLTLVHVANEIRDQDWPIEDFFEERRYLIRRGDQQQAYVLRQQRAEYPMFCLCLRKATRDLVRAGILRESRVGDLRVDSAHAGEILEFLQARQAHSSTYPYYWTRPVRGRYWHPTRQRLCKGEPMAHGRGGLP